MSLSQRRQAKPQIVVCEEDYRRLVDLAQALEERDPAVAEVLLSEMDRAKVVEAGALPAAVVRMGSTVTYSTSDGGRRTVTLVFPQEADIAAGRVSILTPVGTALIGLSVGQSIAWEGRDGRRQELKIEAVEG